MKKHLLLSALALTVMGNVSADDNFIAKELDGRLIQFENNQNTGSCLNVTGDWVTTSPEKANLSHTAWYAEYDADEKGVILSHNGKYVGRMPVVVGSAQHEFDGKHIAAVSNKAEAGRYRLYPIVVDGKTTYGLTCTRDEDGNVIKSIGQTGSWGNTTGWWISDGGAGNGTPVNRWGTGAGTSKWVYNFVDEIEILVNKSTGTLYNQGTTATETGWAKLWKSDKNPGTNPIVHIDVEYNNMKLIGEAVGLAPGASGSNYTFTCEDPMYYVAKVQFDFTSTDHTTTIGVNDQTLTTSAEIQHFELDCGYGETISFHMGGGNTAMTTSNFIVTLRKASKPQLISGFIDSTYGAYVNQPEIWDADLVNKAIASLEPQLDAILPTYVTSDDCTAVPSVCATNLSENKKQIDATADGKTVTFRNLMHNTRYMSTAEAKENYAGGGVTGGLRAHTTDNPDDLNAVWTLIFDEETGAFRLQNYLSEREIGHTTPTEVPVVMAEENEQGHLYEIKPMHFKNVSYEGYTVALWDRTDGDRAYLHCGGANTNQMTEGGQRIVKWSSAVDDAPASAWFISLVEIVNQMDALKSLEGQEVVISNIDNGTYLAAVSNTEIGFINSMRPTAVWNIQVNTKTGLLTLKNLLSQTYANDLTSPLSASANSTIKVDDVESMLDTWHIIPMTATPTEEDAKYSIKAISDEQKEAMIAELHTLYSAYHIGNEPGLFSYETEAENQTYAQTVDAIDSYNTEDGFDYAAAGAAFTFAEKTPTLFDLNSLAGPALIQGAYTPSSYSFNNLWSGRNCISDENHSSGLAGTSYNEIATYVLENGRLHSLKNGIGIINGGSGPKVYEGEDWNVNAESMQVTFTNVGRTTLITTPHDGVARHCYGIKEAGSNNTFGGTNNEGGTITWGQNAGTPPQNYAYTIWYVKNLTVDVTGGYKLWRTPVAVNFDGNTDSGAYVVSVNGTRITTDPVEGSDTYGAGTIFILTKTVNLNVENGVAVDAPAAGLGHHAKQTHTMTAGKVYLSIHTDAVAPETPEAEQNGYTMYFDAPAGNTVKMDVVIPTEDTEKLLEAHEALIEATNSTEDPLQHGTTMDLALGGSSDTTQLTEITAEGRNTNSVYDLQGRKLAAPVKGFNIINGQKVLVK